MTPLRPDDPPSLGSTEIEARDDAPPSLPGPGIRLWPFFHRCASMAAMTPISSIRNLGPATETAFNRAGISSAEELRALGADAAYARLLAAGERPHFIGYYVLHMALQGRPWNDCKGAEKAALRESFDRLVAGEFDQGRAKVENFMREIGLYEVRRG